MRTIFEVESISRNEFKNWLVGWLAHLDRAGEPAGERPNARGDVKQAQFGRGVRLIGLYRSQLIFEYSTHERCVCARLISSVRR